MEIKDLELRVNKAEEKVKKCEATIVRHQKQLEKKKLIGDEYDIRWKEDDIKGATRKLEDAKRILENWKIKLNLEIENERFLAGNAPEVIKIFLEEWKQKSFDWHVKRFDAYKALVKQLNKEETAAQIEYIKQAPEYLKYVDENGEIIEELERIVRRPSRDMNRFMQEKRLTYRQIQKRLAEFAGSTVLAMNDIRDKKKRLAYLENRLEKEKKAKMLDLIQRINQVVGSMTDASYLEISPKGNLDGYVLGENGKAKIETIGAGGYNIQCFHFRTLVHAV